MFKMFSSFESKKKATAPQSKISKINKVAEINKKEVGYNKYGSIEEIKNEWVPEFIDSFIIERDLSSHSEVGMIKKWGESFVEKEINNDINITAKNKSDIKKLVYDTLDNYCKTNKIEAQKAA